MEPIMSMPSRKTADGEFRDIAHPINPVMREEIQAAVLDAYYSAVNEGAAEEEAEEA